MTKTMTLPNPPEERVHDNYAFQKMFGRIPNTDAPLTSVLTRKRGEPRYVEHVCVASAYWDEAEEATDYETEAYRSNRGVELLDLNDVPEPINVHDQDIWLECTTGEYDEFINDFHAIEMEAA